MQNLGNDVCVCPGEELGLERASLEKKGELCVGGALGDEAGGTGKSVGSGGSKCRGRAFYCALLDWGGHSNPSPISPWHKAGFHLPSS